MSLRPYGVGGLRIYLCVCVRACMHVCALRYFQPLELYLIDNDFTRYHFILGVVIIKTKHLIS